MPALELFLIGLGSGSLGTLLGIGGGVILVPALALVLGVPFRAAVAASLVCIVATSVASSVVYLPRNRVNLPLALELESYTVVGAVVGGVLSGWIPTAPLFFGFAVLIGFSAVRMWPRRPAAPARAANRPAARAWARAASAGAGVVSSLMGVGGGIFKVPILNLVLHLDFESAAATSIYMIGITTAAGAAMYVVRGDVDFHVTAAAVLGTLTGSMTAALLGRHFNTRALRSAFALLLHFVALQMVLRGVRHI